MCVKWHRKSSKEFFVKICKSLIQIGEKSGELQIQVKFSAANQQKLCQVEILVSKIKLKLKNKKKLLALFFLN